MRPLVTDEKPAAAVGRALGFDAWNADATAGYDRRGERAKRDAVRKLHVPINAASRVAR